MDFRLHSMAVGAALLGCLLAAGSVSGQNLITNGSFEDPSVPNEDADGRVTFFAPALLPGGWLLSSGSVDVMRRDGTTQYQVPDGLQALDLTGDGSRGTITRTMNLQPETVYTLSFWLAGNPTCEVGLKRITLIVENVLFTQPTFNTTGWSVTNMGWTLYEYSFVSDGGPVSLLFQSLTGTQCGPMIDDVRVERCLEILQHPAAAGGCEGGSATLSVAAFGEGTEFRWRRNGVLISNGGSFSGATTSTLTINPLTPGTAGTYSCVVFNGCGQLMSTDALVSVAPAPCPGDANSDQTADFADITTVLEFWSFNYAPGTGPGDANCDGVVNFADLTKVLENWAMTCG